MKCSVLNKISTHFPRQNSTTFPKLQKSAEIDRCALFTTRVFLYKKEINVSFSGQESFVLTKSCLLNRRDVEKCFIAGEIKLFSLKIKIFLMIMVALH